MALILCLFTFAGLTSPAKAKRKGKSTSKVTRAAYLEAVDQLRSDDTATIRQALDVLVAYEKPSVVAPIAELLRAGRPAVVNDRALRALGLLKYPQGIGVLGEFTNHRRARTREIAYQSLIGIESPKVEKYLIAGLSDSSSVVRGRCALAMGDRNMKAQAPLLYKAFELGVVEAAISLGKLADESIIDKFAEEIGKIPLPIILSGYDPYLRRRDVGEEKKIEIVERLAELATPQIRDFLKGYYATLPARGNNELKKVLKESILRISTGDKAEEGEKS